MKTGSFIRLKDLFIRGGGEIWLVGKKKSKPDQCWLVHSNMKWFEKYIVVNSLTIS